MRTGWRVWCRLVVVLCGCGLARPAAMGAEEDNAIWGPNQVENPSFELGGSRWWMQRAAETGAEAEPVYSVLEIDDAMARIGTRSVLMSGDAKTNFWRSLESAWIEVKPEQRYKFDGWLRTEKVTQESGQYYNCNVFVRFADEAGTPVAIGDARLKASERLLGTHDWTKLDQIVTVPKGATRARLGCVLTCSGQVWFDDLGLYALESVYWEQRETDRLVIHWESGDGPPEGAVEALETYLRTIEDSVGVRAEQRIDFYKYKSRERKELMTSRGTDAHSEGSAVHTVSWEDRHVLPYIIMRRLGTSIALFSEGIAVHLAGPWAGQDVHVVARSLAQGDQLLPLGQLLDTSSFRSFSETVTYPEAGSFVRYLVELFGMEKFKQLYPVRPQDNAQDIAARFQSVYGMSLTEAEAAWLKFLVPEPKKQIDITELLPKPE